MKTKIITLEAHDDLISVRDKFSWAKTPRILLVWPKFESVSLRYLDLKVLQRHATDLGAQLGLVTRRSGVRRDAEELGIPVFDSANAAQKNPWPAQGAVHTFGGERGRAPRKNLRVSRVHAYPSEAKWRKSAVFRVIVFTLGVLSVLSLASLFIPRVEITIFPPEQTQQVVIPVKAIANGGLVSISGEIPARVLTLPINGERSMNVSSIITVPKNKARGKVRFINLTQAELEIPKGTLVSTVGQPAIQFLTLHDTLLPARLNEIVEVPVEAVLPGAQGNVAAEAIQAVEGMLGLSMTVTNPESTTAGSDLQAVGATETDRMNLRIELLKELEREAESQFRRQIEAGDWLLTNTITVSEVMEESYEPSVGSVGNTLSLAMQVKVSVHYLLAQDLQFLADTTLDAAVPTGFIPNGPAELTRLTLPVSDQEGNTTFDLQVTRSILREVDQKEVIELLRSQPLGNARELLETKFPGREAPVLESSPRWWPWLPLIPFNINLHIQ